MSAKDDIHCYILGNFFTPGRVIGAETWDPVIFFLYYVLLGHLP